MKKRLFHTAWEFRLEQGIDEFSTVALEKYSDAAGEREPVFSITAMIRPQRMKIFT